MQAKRLAQGLLLVAAVMVISGCGKPRSVAGRWKSGPTNYYFREDGVLFYVAPSGARYRGAYYVDRSTNPWVITSRLHAMDGAGTRDVAWNVEFLTNDRLRVTTGANDDRAIFLLRVKREDEEKKDPNK